MQPWEKTVEHLAVHTRLGIGGSATLCGKIITQVFALAILFIFLPAYTTDMFVAILVNFSLSKHELAHPYPKTKYMFRSLILLEGVSIVRSGTFSRGLRQVAIGMSVGKILLQRDEEDELKRPKLYYSSFQRYCHKASIIGRPNVGDWWICMHGH